MEGRQCSCGEKYAGRRHLRPVVVEWLEAKHGGTSGFAFVLQLASGGFLPPRPVY